MQTLYVSYAGDADTRFDRNYYVNQHLPLVKASWGAHGLKDCAAFWPATADGGTVAVAALHFEDEASVRDALASAETPRVLADVANFTDAAPALSLAHPL